MKKLIIPIISCILLAPFVSGQNRDKAVFRESKPGFYQNSIMKDDREVREKAEPARVTRTFAVDLANVSLPNKLTSIRTSSGIILLFRREIRTHAGVSAPHHFSNQKLTG